MLWKPNRKKLKIEKDKIMKIGDRVLVFDNLLFKDDVSTPLYTTRVEGVITKFYKTKYNEECVDVKLDRIRFPHENGIEKHMSRGHFIRGVKLKETK